MRRTPPVAGRGAAMRAGRTLAAVLVALTATLTTARAATAQAVPAPNGPLALDAGVARIRQAGTVGLTAPSVGAAWSVRAGRATFQAAGVAAAAEGRGSAQATLAAARAFGAAAHPWSLDAGVSAARVPNTPWSVLLLAGARQDVTWRRAADGTAFGGAWARAQGGVARQVGRASPSVGGEAGAWGRAGAGGRVGLTLGAAVARVEERGLVAAGVDAYAPARVGVADAVASYERAGRHVEFGLWAGARGYAPRGLHALPPDDADPTKPGAPLRWRATAAATAAVWLSGAVALTGGAGVVPNDPVRGLPAVRYALFGLRLRPRLGVARIARPPAVGGGVAGAANAVALTVDAPAPSVSADGGDVPGGNAPIERAPAGRAVGVAADSLRRVTVRVAAGARRVQLRAAATGWRAVDLARGADGAWAAALALAPGPHRVQVRVDDGTWRPPGNLPAVDDEFGGAVGLLVVP